MKLRTLAVVGGAAYVYAKGPRDPREWAGYLAEEFARTKEHAAEAVAAGTQAAARKRDQIDHEILEAYGTSPVGS